MPNTTGKITIKVASLAIGIPVGIATRKAVLRGWAAVTTDTPPSDTGPTRVAWNDEIVLAAVSSVAVVFSQRFVRTGVERAYGVIFGEPPVTRTRQQRRADRNAKRKWKKGVGKMPKPQAQVAAS